MPRSGLVATALLLAALPLARAGGQAEAAPSSSRWIERCVPASEDTRAADSALTAFAEQLERQAPAVSLAALQGSFDALQRLPCFAAMAEWGDIDEPFESVAQLRAWWDEGGQGWMRGLAEGWRPGQRLWVQLPPDPRPLLVPEEAAMDDPRRILACPDASPECGLETTGWALRAEAALEANSLSLQRQLSWTDPSARCAREARGAARAHRYLAWFKCIDRGSPFVAALPAGRMRAPTRGVLSIRGCRDDYWADCTGTDEREYDLSTGVARILVRYRSAARSTNDTSGPPANTYEEHELISAVPLDAVREATWMLLLQESVSTGHRRAYSAELPRGITPRFQEDEAGSFCGGGFGGGGHPVVLDWAWKDGGRVLAESRLNLSDPYSAAEQHAAMLLRVAEAPLIVPQRAPRRYEK